MKFDLKQACENCPFRMSTELIGSPDWLKEVFTAFTGNVSLNHSCHKTDPGADGYKGISEKQFCAGFLALMKNEGVLFSNEVTIALMDGTVDWAEVRTEGIYQTFKDLVLNYLLHWQKTGLLPKNFYPELNKVIHNEEVRNGNSLRSLRE